MKVFVCLLLIYFTINCLTNKLANAVCNICQENNAACTNLTSFHLCFGASEPDTKQLFTCPDGLVCTNLPNICFQRNTLPASCGDNSGCKICNVNQVFACTSRTTFAFCFGATVPSDVVGTCPFGTICDASSTDICVAKLTPNSIICDIENPSVSSLTKSLFGDNDYDSVGN